jgi:serine O-acetyltransferase
VVGNPGRTVVVDGQRIPSARPDIEHTRLPDPVAEAMMRLVRRLGELEAEVQALRSGRAPGEPCDDAEAEAQARAAAAREEIAALLGLHAGAGI